MMTSLLSDLDTRKNSALSENLAQAKVRGKLGKREIGWREIREGESP
jgi:hypothetical protein